MEQAQLPIEASIEGLNGHLLHEDAAAALWEVSLAPGSAISLMNACQGGAALNVVTTGRVIRAVARQWWVLPTDSSFSVRVALEKVRAA